MTFEEDQWESVSLLVPDCKSRGGSGSANEWFIEPGVGVGRGVRELLHRQRVVVGRRGGGRADGTRRSACGRSFAGWQGDKWVFAAEASYLSRAGTSD